MGRRGTAPKPSGRHPTRYNPLEARPKRARKTPPKDLDDATAHKFRELADELVRCGLLSVLDVDTLVDYSRCSVLWDQVNAFISEHGVAYPVWGTNDKGRRVLRMMKEFPQTKVWLQLMDQKNRLRQELGMTPSARTRIHATGEGAPIVKRVTKIDKLSALIMNCASDGRKIPLDQVRDFIRQVPIDDQLPEEADRILPQPSE